LKLSICIPTYNRSKHLNNCLYSIYSAHLLATIDYEICVSDNCSSDNTGKIVSEAPSNLLVRYIKNDRNIGVARNIINVVAMAKGEYVWLIGDDDLLLEDSLLRLGALVNGNQDVDFFYGNSYLLNLNETEGKNIQKIYSGISQKTPRFSTWKIEGKLPFLDLINPEISFDFLGGMFLSIFRKSNWDEHVGNLDGNALKDERMFSHFDNTFPHITVFAHAFSDSTAYFNAKPLNICLSGVREWSAMYPMIHSVRLIEGLKKYYENGLTFRKYHYYKNFALNNFIPDLAYMVLNSKNSGFTYISIPRLICSYFFYPNTYLSLLYYISRKIKQLFSKFINYFAKY